MSKDNESNDKPYTKVEVSSNQPDTKKMVLKDEPGLSKEGLIETELGMSDIDMEAFMHELVVVEVHDSTDENANPLPVFSVNGQSQIFPRGVKVGVKRKFVEALARCKETKHTFVRPDPANPDYQERRSKTALAYPFAVHQDDNPKGRAWLNAIVAEQDYQ